MNTPRSLRVLFIRGVLGAALTTSSLLAVTPEEVAILRAKAENGNAVAQYNLGMIYAAVNDPISDPIEAYVWLNLAADNGATGRALVILNSQLTPEQINEGKRRLDARRTELHIRKNPGSALASSSPTPAPATTRPAVANPISNISPILSGASSSTSPVIGAPPPLIAAAPSGIEAPDPAALQAELRKMSAELAGTWKENDELKAALAKANSAGAGAEQLRQQNAQLASNLKTASGEVAKLREAVAKAEGERTALEQKLAAAAEAAPAASDNLQVQLASANNKLTAAEAQLSEAMASINELNSAKQTIATLGQKIDALTAENQRLSSIASQSDAASSAKAAADKELGSLRAELERAKTDLAAAQSKVAASDAAAAQLEQTQMKLEAAVRSFEMQQKEIDRLQKSLANIDGERESLAKQLEAAKAAPAKTDPGAAEKIAQLTAELGAARTASTEAASARGALADIQAKLKTSEENLARATQAREQLTRDLAAARTIPKATPEEISRLQAQLNDAIGRLNASEQALARTKEERQRAAESATQAASQQLTKLQAELEQTKQQLASATATAESAGQERDALKQQLETSAAKRDAGATAEVAELSNRLKETESALAAANTEREALADRLAAAERASIAAAASAAAVTTVAAADVGPGSAAVAAPAEDTETLRKELADTQAKLDAALRTYQLKDDEVDRLQKSLANIDGERAQLAERLQNANTEATDSKALAAANQEATAQLAALHEQLRQSQNQIASLASENAALKNRYALVGAPPSSSGLSAPTRPGTAGAAAAAVRPPTPTPAPAARTHVIASGDTLTKIARRYYGSSEKWNQILEANRGVIRDPNNLTVGATIRIP